jgi:biotin synthase
LASRILDGEEISRDEALSVLNAPDCDVPALLAAAFEIRYRYFGNKVKLYYLINAKSGLCPEDCKYCSQSKVASGPVERYAWLSTEEIVKGAQRAYDFKACTYCIVGSGRGPTDREVEHVVKVVREIKSKFPLQICACMGLLKPHQALMLAEAGVDRFNHNLNTSEEYHDEICDTHTFKDRWANVELLKANGILPCCGGIIGMGESKEDVVSLAFSLKKLGVDTIPVNFHIPIAGTPFADRGFVSPQYALKALCMFRFIHPDHEVRIAGGRELHLKSLQPLGLYPASAFFVSDYLTAKGQSPDDDFRLIEDLGFEIVRPEDLPPRA